MIVLTIKVIQTIVALGLLNVWLVRLNKKTAYRGGDANTLKEEFATYGLPAWSCYLVGFLKISSALFLIMGLWYQSLVLPAAILVSFLMLGAVSMHAKIGDPIKKTLPAAIMLLMCLIIILSIVI